MLLGSCKSSAGFMEGNMHGNWPACLPPSLSLARRRKKGKCDGGGGGIEMIRDSGRTIEVSIDRTSDPIGGGALSIAGKNCDEAAPSVRSFVRLSHIFYSVADFFLSFGCGGGCDSRICCGRSGNASRGFPTMIWNRRSLKTRTGRRIRMWE